MECRQNLPKHKLHKEFAKKELIKHHIFHLNEDFLYHMNTAFRDHLEKIGYPLSYSETPGNHDWFYWEREIRNAIHWMLEKEEA